MAFVRKFHNSRVICDAQLIASEWQCKGLRKKVFDKSAPAAMLPFSHGKKAEENIFHSISAPWVILNSNPLKREYCFASTRQDEPALRSPQEQARELFNIGYSLSCSWCHYIVAKGYEAAKPMLQVHWASNILWPSKHSHLITHVCLRIFWEVFSFKTQSCKSAISLFVNNKLLLIFVLQTMI